MTKLRESVDLEFDRFGIQFVVQVASGEVAAASSRRFTSLITNNLPFVTTTYTILPTFNLRLMSSL